MFLLFTWFVVVVEFSSFVGKPNWKKSGRSATNEPYRAFYCVKGLNLLCFHLILFFVIRLILIWIELDIVIRFLQNTFHRPPDGAVLAVITEHTHVHQPLSFNAQKQENHPRESTKLKSFWFPVVHNACVVVSVSHRLTISAECPMQLEDFPMDAHACPLKFGSCE